MQLSPHYYEQAAAEARAVARRLRFLEGDRSYLAAVLERRARQWEKRYAQKS